MSAKVRKPKLYNLFWYASEIERRRAVALNRNNVLDEKLGVPAVILYPAFATPGVHVRGENDDMFELLLVTPSSVKVTPEVVNQYLKASSKLDPEKKAPFRPLFEGAEDLGKLIEVAPAKPENGIVGTHSVFHGVLSRHSALHHLFVTPEAAKKVFQASDPLRRLGALGEAVSKLVGKPVDKRPEEEILADCYAFHKVRVHASCLEKAPLRPGEPGATVREIQDDVVRALLEQMNGKDLRGKSKGNWAETAHGPGMHCFPITGTKVDLARAQEDQPIVSYHPLFVYDELEYANIGHVADVHLNARQQVLRRSPARVIEAPGAQSPEVGKLINVYSENLLSILMQLKQKPMDVLLVGGDIVDHARNSYPFQNQAALREPSAADVWKMVDLGDGYEDRYQAFADHITFYSILRDFYDSEDGGRPAFIVSGNHDAYQDAYGISPRVWGIRANEGVPADHNLTFYEAMLAFGRSYGEVKNKSNFTPEMFRWFYSIFTPFSDFAVSLPRQRIVGLAWGDDEKLIDFLPGAQGFGHLPRANESASEVQLRVVRQGLSTAKKTVLFSHFTFVSYDDDIKNSTEENGRIILSKKYTKQDLGTFQIARDQLYPIVADPNQVQCVLTGHSHRKGVYFLGARQGGAYETEMRELFNPVKVSASPSANRVPIIVSDSAGPLPRLNLEDEFLTWGSDRPSGTFVQSASDGGVARIEAVRCLLPGSRPRLAVAMEYLHVLKKQGLSLMIAKFPLAEGRTVEHRVIIESAPIFHDKVEVAGVVFHSKTGQGDWIEPISLTPIPRRSGESEDIYQFTVLENRAAGFMAWLTTPGGGRFVSVSLKLKLASSSRKRSSAGPDVRTAELATIYDASHPWCFEAEVVGASQDVFMIVPVNEKPNFTWRERSSGALMLCANYREKPKYQCTLN